jgi:hypothetical protein
MRGIWFCSFGPEQAREMFIPKHGKLDYTEAKSYHPISLSSFLLKTMEKLVDRYIRDGELSYSAIKKPEPL